MWQLTRLALRAAIPHTLNKHWSPLWHSSRYLYTIDTTNNRIEPSEEEEKVFHTLTEAVRHADTGTTLRVAGGWVRNKLLGIQGGDIDIALDNMTGEQFTSILVDYQQVHGLETRTVGVIKANPAQSKHLSTATTQVCGQAIDFVNLRTEDYTETSRIPTIEIGTPVADAYRRDFTINALFYNLHSRQVEDFTERGLSDLAKGQLATPQAPRQTLLDDPLRAIRALRFAAVYDFAINSELEHALHSSDVHDALESKVSRERVRAELQRVLQSSDVLTPYLTLADKYTMLDTIICPQVPSLRGITRAPATTMPALLSVFATLEAHRSTSNPSGWASERLATFLALRSCTSERAVPIPDDFHYWVTDIMKLGNKDSAMAKAILNSADAAGTVINVHGEGRDVSVTDIAEALLHAKEGYWVIGLYCHAALVSMFGNSITCSGTAHSSIVSLADVFSNIDRVVETLKAQRYTDVFLPLCLNGKQLVDCINTHLPEGSDRLQPGPGVSQCLDAMRIHRARSAVTQPDIAWTQDRERQVVTDNIDQFASYFQSTNAK